MGSEDNAQSLRTAIILYGSETGNSQDLAEELARLTERLHFITHVSELNAVKAESLESYSLTVIVISTTGQGDLPANARTFWKTLLLKRLPPSYLNGVKFALFGLGDSSYPKYNWAAKKLHKRLLQLGGNEIYPYGEGDQQHPEGPEGTFIQWSLDFRKHLLDTYPLPQGQPSIPDNVQLPPKWTLKEQCRVDDKFSSQSHLEEDTRPIPDSMTATVTENKRITPQNHWQDVRHISLTVFEGISYAPGDLVSILPKNFPSDVERLLRLMNWMGSADQPIMFIPYPGLQPNASPPIPYLRSYPHLTLRILLTDYLDIRAIPRRSFFSNIAHYTDNVMHKERLLEFSNPENVDELWDYTTRPRRSILEVLEEFESVKIPWQHAASIFPAMRGRQFSIASGGELKQTAEGGTRIELLIAIVKYRTVIKKIREGLCTRYFSILYPGSTIKIQLQKGGLNLSVKQLLGPTVLIGPGTGLAPLRAIIWEKAALVKAYHEKHPGIAPQIGTTILLFGGRNRAADYFFEDEWRQFAESIDLKVITAFSRDQRQKIYVQDKIREKRSVFLQLLHDQSGSVFVCGSSGLMPQAVREALVNCFQQSPDIDRTIYTRGEAERHLIDMEKVGRYKQETW